MYEVVINFLKSATGTAPQLSDWLAMLGVVLTITFGCVGAVQTYFTVLQWLIARRDARNRESILFETAGSGFSARDFDAIRTTYVEPDVSQVDPNGSESERQILSTREAAFSALHRFLKNTAQESKFLLVLADSGAGKTSLLAALVQRLNSRSAFIAVSLSAMEATMPSVKDAFAMCRSRWRNRWYSGVR